MAGLTDVEIAVSPSAECPNVDDTQATMVQRTLEVIRGDGVLASTLDSSGLASDFDAQFFVKTHPMTFAHGAGALPNGMGLTTYARILTERGVGRPDEQGGEDVMLTVTMFNVLQRHTALAATRGRLRGRPNEFARLDAMTDADFGRIFQACVSGNTVTRSA